MSVNDIQLTPEEIQRWKELQELDSSAFAGRELSKEEFTVVYNSIVSGSLLVECLEKMRTRKEELLKEIAQIERCESLLLKEIEKNRIRQEQKKQPK